MRAWKRYATPTAFMLSHVVERQRRPNVRLVGRNKSLIPQMLYTLSVCICLHMGRICACGLNGVGFGFISAVSAFLFSRLFTGRHPVGLL